MSLQHRRSVLAYEDYCHPHSVEDVRKIVLNARAGRAQVRVRGAYHSEPGSVLGDGYAPSGHGTRPVVNVMLDRLTDIVDTGTGTVIVGAGTSMGGDPHALGEKNPQRDPGLSLFDWLDSRGHALPITGGISHQTIAGFLATGSAGGSLSRSIHDVVERIRFVDGTGTVRDVTSNHPDFPAALVSLGLFGIVVEIEIRPIPAYGIRGLRSTQRVSDSDVDLFSDPAGPGRISLRRFLETKPVSRVMWWPQRGVERMELWEAHCDVAPPTSTSRVPQALGVVNPVEQILARALYAVVFEGVAPDAGDGTPDSFAKRAWDLATSPVRATALSAKLACAVLDPRSATYIDRADLLALLEALVAKSAKPPLASGCVPRPRSLRDDLGELVRDLAAIGAQEKILALAIRIFVKLHAYAYTGFVDPDGFARRYTADSFLDTWKDGLPMDNPVHDRLLPVRFTELWLPIDRAAVAMRALEARFARDGLAATGTFSIEVYGAKKSPAWLSAAYDRDVVRIDPFHYDDGDEAAIERFFDQFFDTLEPFGPRFHLGKALSAPWSTTGVAYRRSVMPKLAAFLDLRVKYDPDGVFLTEYWTRHLGIDPTVRGVDDDPREPSVDAALREADGVIAE